MNYPITTKSSSPLSLVVRGAVHGALWLPRKIVKAVKVVKEAASNLIARVRLAAQRRPAQAVQPQRSLPQLASPSRMSSITGDPLSRLQALQTILETSKAPAKDDVLEFLQLHGEHFTPGDVNRLNNSCHFPNGPATVVTALIAAYKQEQASWTKV